MHNEPMDAKLTLRIAIVIVAIIVIFIYAVSRKADQPENMLTEVASITEDDFEVQEYIYSDANMNKVYLLVVKNNSDYTVDFDCNVTAYEANDSNIGINYNRINAIEPGNAGCMEFNFENENAEKFEYELYYEISKAESSMEYIETSEERMGNSVTVSCTNNSKGELNYLRADVLFLQNEEVVFYDFSYIHDENSSAIGPGKTLTRMFECEEDFDDCIVYYSCQSNL